jgi:hypothetical protein
MGRVAVAALALAVSGVAACGKGGSTPDATTARQLAALIADRKAGCHDFSPSAATTDPVVGDAGACTVAGQQINLAVFTSQEARDRGTLERFKGCIGRRSVNPGSDGAFAYVRGPTWLVLSADTPAVTRVGKALHTDVETAPC